ncbi:hypothetical protein B5G38_07805 [Gemmiger sp. An87]|nr:hypothetical protein B5G38_07805 [Gemmiger sp. An87]
MDDIARLSICLLLDILNKVFPFIFNGYLFVVKEFFFFFIFQSIKAQNVFYNSFFGFSNTEYRHS